MKISFIIILTFLCFSAARPQSDFDSLVFSAPVISISSTRINLNYEDSFVPVRVFQKEEIQNINGNRVSDILQRASNVFIKSYGGLSSLKTISINGMNAEHTLILLNGIRMNTVQNSQYDLSLISNEDIESVQVMPSGSSAYYGSDAVSGVVNISTFGNQDKERPGGFGGSLTLNSGSYNYRNGSLSLKYITGKNSFKTGFGTEKTDDNFNYFFNNGYAEIEKRRENNSMKRNNLLLQYSFTAPAEVLNIMSAYSSEERHIPGVESGSAPMNALQRDETWNTILNYEKKFSGENKLNASVNFQNYLMNYSFLPYENSYYRNLSSGSSLCYEINAKNLTISAGGDFLAAGIQSNELETGIKRFSTALFTNIIYGVTDNLKLFPSIRIENISDISRTIVTSKFGVNYKPIKNDILILRSSAGNSFRAPTFNELYWKTGGNTNLKPETSFNADAGVMSDLNYYGTFRIELNYSHVIASNKIVWMQSPSIYWTPVNISSSESDAVSASVSYMNEIAGRYKLNANISYTRTVSVKTSEDYPGDASYKKQLIFIPVHAFKFDAGFEYYKTGVSIYGNYTGERYSDYENTISMQSVFTLDGNIHTTFNIGPVPCRAAFEINNITNSNYQIIAGYPMPLRNYKLSITLSY
ncbi:MAG: TonB-dependent receptor [Bacteroidetes bacterium]|nr:TonB-dependent receptor [Bacteroidota bacterium]